MVMATHPGGFSARAQGSEVLVPTLAPPLWTNPTYFTSPRVSFTSGIIIPPLVGLLQRLNELDTHNVLGMPVWHYKRSIHTTPTTIVISRQCKTSIKRVLHPPPMLCSCQINQINLRKLITFKPWLQTCPLPPGKTLILSIPLLIPLLIIFLKQG